jgi:mannose-1-phosphate guanylyltransferase/mannose-6-phosphate isomerase
MPRLVVAILCGGSGTRLWPLSRAARPKQFIPLTGPLSLLAETVARAVSLPEVAPEETLLIANEKLVDLVRMEAAVGGAPNATTILEPEGRNTAAAAALAALAALRRAEDALVLLLPSDHHIGDAAAFQAAVATGVKLAAAGKIVTFGIRPTAPQTGYGYIAPGAPLDGGFAVAEFIEKPELEEAKRLVAEGRLWNSGIYLFGARIYLEELRRFEPHILAAVEAAVQGGVQSAAEQRLDPAAWAKTPKQSIDKAVAERTDRAAVAPVDMAWSDVGSYAALWEIGRDAPEDNVVSGDVMLIDAAGCYVRAEGRKVALLGVQDLIVIETADAVFVAPRDRAEEVKKLVEQLAAGGEHGFL